MTDADSTPSTSRDVLTVAIVAIIALMLGINLFMFIDDGGEEPLVDGQAPAFELPVFDTDETARLEDYRGQVVVLDFWATWCPPCREQMPALEEIATDPEFDGDLEVFSVNTDPQTDDRLERIEEFLAEENLTLPTLIDNGRVQGAYRAGTIPTLVVIDPDGEVTYRAAGLHDAPSLRELIRTASH